MIKPKMVLVIGGGGFIGRNLLNRLLSMNIRIRCLDCRKIPWMDSSIDFIEGDFAESSIIERAVEGCDVIIHLVSTVLPKTSNDDPEYDISTNLIGTVRLIQYAVKHNVHKFIFMSSGGTVYGISQNLPISENHPNNPLCSYGIVKLAIEKYLNLAHQLKNLNTCSVRLTNPYGYYQRGDISQGAIAVFCHRALHGIPIEVWGDGSVRRDFIYIDDVIDALQEMIQTERQIGEINIGSGSTASIKEIISSIQQELNLELKVIYKPPRDFDVPDICLDIKKAQQILGWNPKTPLTQGIKKTLEWQQSLNR